MRRTQLFLDDALWRELRRQASQQNTTVSELARRALRERYMPTSERRRALLAWVGALGGRDDLAESEAYVRSLRRTRRLDRAATGTS